MKTIIIYSSKYGSTEDCAKHLKAGLSGSVSLVDIEKTNPKTIGLEKYDSIIFGSSIYVGSISKKIRSLCNEFKELLLKKRIAIFICCGFPEQVNEYLSTNFSTKLLQNAVIVKSFGGEARLDKMKALDRLIMKAATKGNHNNLKISQENIDDFIKAINS